MLEKLLSWLRPVSGDEVALSAGAEFNRGLSADYGMGSALDKSEAVRWYRQAAEHGCRRAEFRLAFAYQTGQGVDQDHGQAALWYQRSAEHSDSRAMANLGLLYLRGEGVEADEVEAYTWLACAAGLGHEALRPVVEMLETRITEGAGGKLEIAIDPLDAPRRGFCTWRKCNPAQCESGETT
jgi:TPR repeat protein